MGKKKTELLVRAYLPPFTSSFFHGFLERTTTAYPSASSSTPLFKVRYRRLVFERAAVSSSKNETSEERGRVSSSRFRNGSEKKE